MQGVSQSQVKERRARSREFADEAFRILDQQPLCPSIPLAQGLALLWTFEVNYGQQEVAVALLERFYLVYGALMKEYEGTSASLHEFDFTLTPALDSTALVMWGFFCLEVSVIDSHMRKI